MNTYFSNIHKGTITLGESPEWNLGNIILKFYEDPNETYVDCLVKKKIFGKERLCSLTHLHIDNSDMESFIKDVDDPNKRILIKQIGCILGFGAASKSSTKKILAKAVSTRNSEWLRLSLKHGIR